MNFFRRTIKIIFVFLTVFGLVFSNLPYDAAIMAMQSYVKSRNVIDRIWVASHDGNVVDKFVPFENVIRSLKIKDALAVSNGDGKIFYSISANTTPRTRDYISSTNSFNTAATTVAGATALQTVTKASPTKDEMIAGYVNSAGTLQVMCWNGTSWTNEWTVAAGGTGTTRRFDIAYETNSGDVIVAYSRNAAATNAVDYRTKPGSTGCGTANWAGAASMPTTTSLTTGTVHWVKMASDRRTAQDLISIIWADSNADLGASVWSGTVFGNFPTTAKMEQSLEVVTAAQDVEDFDVEYESMSGNVMVVWANSAGANGTNGAFYNVCTGGTSACTWGTRTAMPTIADDATHLDIAGDPNSNKILYGAIGNAGSDLNRGVWNGSAWTNSAGDAASNAPTAGTKFVAVGWLNNGATNRGILVYYDNGTTNIGWNTVNGTTWAAPTDWVPTPVFGAQRQYDIKVDPINKDRLIFTVNDANSDIFSKRLIMDAAGAFTWSNADGGAAIEANTGSATYKSFNFEYNRYIPTITTLTTGTNPGNSTIAPAPGGVITPVNGFTLTTNTGTDAITSITVNLSTNSGVGTLTITDGADAILGSIGGGIGTGIVTGSNSVPISSTNATTGGTAFKVKVTPLLHTDMLPPDGGTYAITGVVNDWVGTNTKAGQANDTSDTVTIDNNSPDPTTGANATAGDTQVDVSWTPPIDGDFDRVFIYCKTSSMIGGEAPVEGSDPTVDGAACDGTARLKYKGAASPQTITGLSNGTLYYFRIYARDLNGNFTAYSATEQVSATPAQQGPDATSYTNTETALNFSACGSTGCGGRISQQITITGTNFGTPANKDVCTSGATNGCVRIANYTVPAANISSWIATQIVFTIPSGITIYGGSGTTCGGADGNGICVTQNANNDPSGALQFFVFPDITSLTAPLGSNDGAREYNISDTEGIITITGNKFGSGPTGGALTIVGAAVSLPADLVADVTCDAVDGWADTCIKVKVPTGISDTVDSGYIIVTQGTGTGNKPSNSTDAQGALTIWPRVTSILTNAASARECVVTDTDCNDTDTDGLIKLLGNHFGISTGTVQFTGAFGSISATVHATAEGPCDVGGWAATATSVCIETNPTISDLVNVGDITLTRTGDSKTYNRTSYRILPRITSITPSADGVNPDSRTLNGNHFCQSGSCLSAVSWNAAADDGDDVKFGTTNATVTGTPSDTAVAVTVPSLTPGNYTVTLSSNSGSSYVSNGKNFSYLDNTPVNPSSLNQYQSNCSTVITDETTTTSSTVCLKGAVSGGVTGGTLYLQVEVKASGVAFSDTDNTSQSAGTSAPAGGTESVSVTPGQGTFKWRARTCHYNNIGTHNLTCTGTGDYPSAAWVEFETGAVPTNDFTIDSNGPVISNISSGTPGEFSVTITWDTNELATSNVNYGTTTTGPYNFIAPNPADTTADTITPHSVPISTNLNCGTTYYYIVKSADVQGTLTTSAEQTFTTGTCNPRVMKSVEFDWVEETSPTTVTTQQDRASLSAAIQESSDTDFTIRSAVLEMRGVMIGSGGSSPTANLWINSASTPTAITFPNTTIPQAYTVRYNIPTPATNLNISPLSASTNTVHFQFGGGFSKSSLVNIKLIVTYDYTP